MRRFYTAESVTEGHPDKVCDQIADAILDECLRYDPSSRVACEVLATRGNVFVAGEITSGYEPPVFDVIRKVLEECGYCTDGIEMDTFVHQQSPDIAKAVSVSKEFRDNIGAKLRDRSRGAGDQGVMVGYACDDTPQLMPMPTVLAHRITRELSACRRICKQWGTENWKNLYIFQILCFRKNGRNPLRSGTTYVYDNKSYYR